MISIAKRKANDDYWVMNDNTVIQMPFRKCKRGNIPYIMSNIALTVTPYENVPDDFKKYIEHEELKQHTVQITRNVERMEKNNKTNKNEKASIYFNEDFQYLNTSEKELMSFLLVDIPAKGNIIGYRIDPFFDWVITKWTLPSENGSIRFNIHDLTPCMRETLDYHDHCLCGQSKDKENVIMIMPGTNQFVVLGYDCIKRFTGVNIEHYKQFKNDIRIAEEKINNYDKEYISSLLKTTTRVYKMLLNSDSKTKQLTLLDDISNFSKGKAYPEKSWDIVSYLFDLSKVLILNGFITLQKDMVEWSIEYTKKNFPDITRNPYLGELVKTTINKLNSHEQISDIFLSIEKKVIEYQPINNRVYFNCINYHTKEIAKKFGCLFDNVRKIWYCKDDFHNPNGNIHECEKIYKSGYKFLFIKGRFIEVRLSEISNKMRGNTSEEEMEEILDLRKEMKELLDIRKKSCSDKVTIKS